MRRMMVVLLVMGLLGGAVATAEAGKRKKAKASPVTLYLHGQESVGEIDLANNFGAAYNKMDATEPEGSTPKSITPPAWGGPPWNDCAGMYILPVWTGALKGRIKGDVKVTLHAVSAPRPIEVQIWADIAAQTCASNDVSQGQYPEPTLAAVADGPAGSGTIEVVFEDVDVKVLGMLMLQLRPAEGPFPGRILYDSADFASSIELECIPSSGKSCV